MNPCELNSLISSVANLLYATLSKKDFACLNVIVSELSKSMFSMQLLEGICTPGDKGEQAETEAEEA